jgi:hypothetical protein
MSILDSSKHSGKVWLEEFFEKTDTECPDEKYPKIK